MKHVTVLCSSGAHPSRLLILSPPPPPLHTFTVVLKQRCKIMRHILAQDRYRMREKARRGRKPSQTSLRNKEDVEAQASSSTHCSSLLPSHRITITKSSSQRKGFISLPRYNPSWREAKAGTQGRNQGLLLLAC